MYIISSSLIPFKLCWVNCSQIPISEVADPYNPDDYHPLSVLLWASLVAQMIKNLPAMWETWVQSLGWEDPLEEGMSPLQYSCLENHHGQRCLAGYSPWGRKELDMTEWLNTNVLLVSHKTLPPSVSELQPTFSPHIEVAGNLSFPLGILKKDVVHWSFFATFSESNYSHASSRHKNHLTSKEGSQMPLCECDWNCFWFSIYFFDCIIGCFPWTCPSGVVN